MNQGTKIVAVVLFVLFVGTGIYYVTLSPAKPASPSATRPTEPVEPRDPGTITMNTPTATGAPAAPNTPRIADPLATTAIAPAPTVAATTSVPPAGPTTVATGATPSAGATPARVALGPGGTPSAVMPPLTVNRPATGTVGGSAAGTAPTTGISGGTAPGVPAVRPTSPSATDPNASAPVTTAAASSSVREHVVASGDTLSSIAAKYLGSEARWEEIAKANPGVNPNSMRVGTKLSIPAGGPAPKASASASPTVGTNPSAAPASASTSDREYVVKAGDTLSAIARQTLGNADWEAIYDANRDVIGPNPAALRVGMKLSIPKRS